MVDDNLITPDKLRELADKIAERKPPRKRNPKSSVGEPTNEK